MDQLQKLRPVGRLEKYSTARHHLRFYLNAAVAATYTLPASCTLPLQEYIYSACATLIGQHPILSAIPVAEDSNEPYYARLPEINLDQPVSFTQRTGAAPGPDEDDSELDALLQTQHNTPFHAPAPHWRLLVLTDASSSSSSSDDKRRFTAIFVFHHAIGDGTSGKAFHRTLLQALRVSAAAPTQTTTQTTIPSPSNPLLPNVEHLHPLPLSIPCLLSVLFREKVWSPPRDPALWTGSEISPPTETLVRHLVIAKAPASHFRDCCRANSTTVTATLQTVVARAFFACLPSRFGILEARGAISTRRWMRDPRVTDEAMGVWVQGYDERYTRESTLEDGGGEFPWSEAKRSRETIEKVLAMEGKNADVNLLRYVGDFHEELFRSKLGKHRSGSFEVSNIGALGVASERGGSEGEGEGEGEEELPQLGRMVFSQSGSVAGSAVQVSAASGGDGCLVLAFSWQRGVVVGELVEGVMGMVRREVNAIAASS